MKDGRQVRPTDTINVGTTADGQFFLEFKHCSPDDDGTYTVVATNEEGATECPVRLTVNRECELRDVGISMRCIEPGDKNDC